MTTPTLFEMEMNITPSGLGECLCGGELPKRPAYKTPAHHCSYWCSLVENGPEFYTLQTIGPWLKGNRPTSDAARSRTYN